MPPYVLYELSEILRYKDLLVRNIALRLGLYRDTVYERVKYIELFSK